MVLVVIRFLIAAVLFAVVFPFYFFLFIIRFRHPNSVYWYNLTMAPALLRVFGLTLEIRGGENFDNGKARVIVANHQSNFDVVAAGKCFPKNCRVLGKRSLIYIPVFGWLYYLSGQVLINRRSHGAAVSKLYELETSIQSEGVAVWIFPEGTRSQGTGLAPFKKGAFYTAIHCNVPIQPVVFSSYYDGLNLRKWHSGHIVVEILPEINTDSYSEKQVPELMKKTHSIIEAGIAQVDSTLSS